MASAPLPALGPIPAGAEAAEAWARHWPAWKAGRQRLDQKLRGLRERLRLEGEAAAAGPPPSWWDLPSRQRQTGRLRYLRRLQEDLEAAAAWQFQAQAVEMDWRNELQKRQAMAALSPSLSQVLKDLQDQAEKDLKNKQEWL